MKIIITESQHKFLVEQMPEPGDKGYEVKKPTKAQQKRSNDYAEEGGIKNEPTNVSIHGFYNPKDKHTILTILQIGTAFIPYVGPFISSGIGLYDAKTYYDEGDKKTAGLIAMFSIIPGIGGLASKLGLTKWGAKALGQIGKKISLGKKLTPVEMKVVSKVAQHKDLIKAEMKKIGKTATTKQGSQAVRKQLTKVTPKKVVKKGGKFVAKNVFPYVGANVAYNTIYDKLNPQQQFVDFTKIDVNKISAANKQAALNVKF
jgi:hypothetical protein